MNKFLAILILSISLTTSSYSNDIEDFEIEGISIGDSLLDYLSEDSIERKQNAYSDKGFIYRLKDFYSLTFIKSRGNFRGLKSYDDIQFHIRAKDKSYRIHGITGSKYFDNMNNCKKELNSAEKSLDNLFENAKKLENEGRHSNNKAYITRIEYHFKDGFIRASCQDWDANTTIPDGLVLTITSMELQKFLKKVYNP